MFILFLDIVVFLRLYNSHVVLCLGYVNWQDKVTEDLPMPPLFQFLTLLGLKIFVAEKV